MMIALKIILAIITVAGSGALFVFFLKDKIPAEKKGQSAPTQRLTAVLACCGNEQSTDVSFDYAGELTCSSASLLFGGDKSCPYACIGYGDCEKICPENAITMKNGLPVIDSLKCTFCKKCIEICPKGLIRPQSSSFSYYVACSNKRFSKTEKYCETGCNGCGKCIEVCEKKAISYNGRRIIIDDNLCDLCGKCIEVCDRNVIKHV